MPLAGSRLTILIIDDSPEDRFAARVFMSDCSMDRCTIHEADSGASGIEAMRRLRPDCVLLDHHLADMSGFDVLDQIREPSGDPAFAVIMLTGSGDEALAAAAMRAGAQDYLSKDDLRTKTLPLTIHTAMTRFELIRSRRGHEDRLRLFIDHVPAAVAMFDCDMRLMKASKRFVVDMVSAAVEPAALIGRTVYQAIPDLPAHWNNVYRRVLAGETLSNPEECFVRADGRIDWLHWEMTPWFESNGAVAGILLFSEQINARKEAESAIRTSEERLRISQEAGGVGSWDWNVATGNLFWSRQQYVLYGLDPSDGPVDYERWLTMLHPDDRDRVNTEVRSALSGDDYETRHFEFRIILSPSSGGDIRWLQARAEVKRDVTGAPLRMVGVNIDVTERRKIERTLRRLTEDLEKRVAEEVAARESAQARLFQSQRMEALGQLAGGIAHDFNNVLQAVSGGLALIHRRATDPDAVRRFSTMAIDAADRGASITGRLLSFSRSGELKSEPVSPVGLLAMQREMLVHTLGPSIVVSIQADPALPSLFADKSQLETVLVNLATNARDAMPAGGSLIMRAAAESVAAGTQHPAGLAPGDYLSLSIIDTGDGMDAPTLARASEPFFTTKPVGKGTGLGLAMARGFAEQSGGGFALESSLGEGTAVTLWFPRSTENRIVASDGPAVVEEPGKARILLVDDDPLVINVLASTLSDEGHQVTLALDAFAALAHLDAAEPFDLLVTDFAMPGMNGIILIQEARLRRPLMPVMLLTGYMEAGVQADIDSQLHGITDVLRKPFPSAILLDHVAAILRRFSSTAENAAPAAAHDGPAFR